MQVLSKLLGWAIRTLSVLSLLGIVGVSDVPDLAGAWAMLQVYPQVAELPLVGSSSQTSYVVQFVDIEQDEKQLRMRDRYCFTVVESDSPLATTVIPDAFMASLRPQLRAATLVRDESGETRFIQDRYVEVRGAKLENEESDPLPKDPGDPRIVDQDGDGSLGMTVRIKLLGILDEEIHVVQRVQYALSGVVVSAQRIEGNVEWSDEQVVLDATNPILMAESNSSPDPDPSKHVFVMLRLQDEWTCEWLREHWRAVFGLE